LFEVMRGTDELDSTSWYPNESPEAKNSLTLGVPRNLLKDLDPLVAKNFESALSQFKDKGYKVVDVVLPNLAYALAVYYVIMPAEVSSNLARFDGVKYGLHRDGED